MPLTTLKHSKYGLRGKYTTDAAEIERIAQEMDEFDRKKEEEKEAKKAAKKEKGWFGKKKKKDADEGEKSGGDGEEGGGEAAEQPENENVDTKDYSGRANEMPNSIGDAVDKLVRTLYPVSARRRSSPRPPLPVAEILSE